MKNNKISQLQVVTTPTFDWLAESSKICNSRLLIGSPYVNDGIIGLASLVSKDVSRTLVTRTDLRDFALGASNLESLCALAKDGVVIRSLSDFHAKMYIFDDKSALVTSANATFSGMYRNWECGLGTNDKQVVQQLARILLRGFGAARPPHIMRLKELESLRFPLKAIKASLPEPTRVPGPREYEPAVDTTFSIVDNDALLEGFRGWLRLTLLGVMAMPERGFRLQDLLKVCGPMAARDYPRNHHVPDKLRQQLQRLRNLGIVEFVTPGQYRRTMSQT